MKLATLLVTILTTVPTAGKHELTFLTEGVQNYGNLLETLAAL